MTVEEGPSKTTNVTEPMFVADGNGDLVPSPKFAHTSQESKEHRPQDENYGGMTPKERWALEHEEPSDGVYRG